MDRTNHNSASARERVAARRRARGGQPRSRWSQPATPGPRRSVGSWAESGRLASLALLIGSLLALAYVTTAPRFTVQAIEVTGAEAMPQAAVAELSGAQGQSIWLLDPAAVVERLKTSAYIEDARASVALPDRLVLQVRERRPEVRWQSGGTRYLLDASGRVLDRDTTLPLSDTLVIEDASNQSLQPNDRVDPDALALGRALSLRLPAEFGLQPARIGWGLDTHITVTTADNRTIIFGTSENLDQKLAVLDLLLKDGTAFTLLDLRPSTPFYRNDVPTTPPG